MKKLSTFQISLLVIFGSLGVAGIMIFALVASNTNSSSIGPVTIWGTFDEAQVQPILRDAADADNRLTSVTYIKKDAVSYESDLTSALANGRGPDLFFMREDYALHDGSYALHIPFTSLSQSQFQSTFLDAASPFIVGDGVLSVPLLIDPLVLFWNKDILATAGYTTPPKYWKELPGLVQKLVKKDDSGAVIKSGIALGGFDNIAAAKSILATLILQDGGSITERDSGGVLRSSLAAQGGAAIAVSALQFYTEFADPSHDDYSWTHAFPEARSAFAAGDTAMYIGYASEASKIAQTNPNLNFAVSAMPQIGPDVRALDLSHVYGLSIARTSQNAQGALTIAYLMAAQGIGQPLATSLQMTSALRSAASPSQVGDTKADPASAALNSLVKSAPKSATDMLSYEASISHSWLDPDPEKTNGLFRAMIEDTVSGAQKVNEAVLRADKQMTDILGL